MFPISTRCVLHCVWERRTDYVANAVYQRLPEKWLAAVVIALINPRILVSPVVVPRGRDPFGQHQRSRPLAGHDFLSMRRVLVWYFQPIRFARFCNEYVNRGLPVLERARGLDPWCWPKRSRLLGMGMIQPGIRSTGWHQLTPVAATAFLGVGHCRGH